MTRQPLVLFPADAAAGEPWRVGRGVDGSPRVTPLAVPADATPAAVAVAVAAVAAGPVTLALPSSACLAATVATDGRFRGGWRTGLLYRLEVALPLAAEDVAADFLPHPRQPTALGIAVAVAAVRPLLDALEAAGLAVAAVCPAGLLAVEAERADARLDDGLIVWGHGSAVDLFDLAGGQVTAWFTLPAEADDVRPYLSAVSTAGPVRLAHVPADVAALFEGGRRDADWSAAATAAAVAGRRPVDLARGGLAPRGRASAARRSLAHAAVAATALVVVGCGGLLWRASAYQRLADDQLDRQRQVYRQLFPGRPVPADVRSRLGSEARGLSSPSADGPAAVGPSAVVVLHGLLAALPADVRFRLGRVEVAAGRVEVEGTVPTRSDADALAAAVRDGTGLPVDTPQTQQDGPRAVHFTLTGATATGEGGTGGGP